MVVLWQACKWKAAGWWRDGVGGGRSNLGWALTDGTGCRAEHAKDGLGTGEFGVVVQALAAFKARYKP